MKWATLAAATAAISNALPLDDQPQDLVERDTLTPQLATFDDLALNQALPVPYKGLNFSSVFVETDVQDFGNHKIVIAQSSPNYIGASAGDYPHLSIEGTTTQSFDIDSFYLGFFDSRSPSVRGSQFTVTGWGTGGGRRGPIPFTYSPQINSDFSAPMQKFDIGWTGLRKLYVQIVTDDATRARTVTAMDNVAYTTHT